MTTVFLFFVLHLMSIVSPVLAVRGVESGAEWVELVGLLLLINKKFDLSVRIVCTIDLGLIVTISVSHN